MKKLVGVSVALVMTAVASLLFVMDMLRQMDDATSGWFYE